MLSRLQTPALQSMAGAMLQKSIPFLASIYVARNVGSGEFASFAFALSTANTVTALTAMGLAPAILTTLSRTAADRKLDSQIIAIYLISGLICIFSAILGFVISNFDFSAIEDPDMLLTVSALSPALILLQTTQSTYQGTRRHGKFFIQSCGLAAAVLLSLFIASAIGASATLLNTSYAMAFLIVALISSGSVLHALPFSLNNGIAKARSEIRPIILAQLPFAGYTAIWMLAIYFCNARIASSFPADELAFYNVGFQWYSMMLLIPATMGGILIPHFVANRHSSKAGRQRLKLSAAFAAIATPLTVLVILASPTLLRLYGMMATPDGLSTVRNLIISGGIAFTMTPALQELMALKRFHILLTISLGWSAIALPGAYFYADGASEVSLCFLLAYCAVAVIVLLHFLTTKDISTSDQNA